MNMRMSARFGDKLTLLQLRLSLMSSFRKYHTLNPSATCIMCEWFSTAISKPGCSYTFDFFLLDITTGGFSEENTNICTRLV